MSEQPDKNYPRFEHPKLPFAWIATTFIAPVLVLILPQLFTSDEIPMTTLAIVALGLLSALLIVCCIILALQAYESAFNTQVLRLHIEGMEARIEEKAISLDDMKLRMLENKAVQEYVDRRIDSLENAINSNPETKSEA